MCLKITSFTSRNEPRCIGSVRNEYEGMKSYVSLMKYCERCSHFIAAEFCFFPGRGKETCRRCWLIRCRCFDSESRFDFCHYSRLPIDSAWFCHRDQTWLLLIIKAIYMQIRSNTNGILCYEACHALGSVLLLLAVLIRDATRTLPCI